MTNNITFKTLFSLFIVTTSIVLFSCSSTNKKDVTDVKKTITDENNSVTEIGIDKEYLKEGFIDNNTFRVIILSSSTNCDFPKEEVLKKSRKRALATLSKFLISKNRIVNSNTKAKLKQLIHNNGTLLKIKKNCDKGITFAFNIESRHLKSQISDIAPKR